MKAICLDSAAIRTRANSYVGIKKTDLKQILPVLAKAHKLPEESAELLMMTEYTGQTHDVLRDFSLKGGVLEAKFVKYSVVQRDEKPEEFAVYIASAHGHQKWKDASTNGKMVTRQKYCGVTWSVTEEVIVPSSIDLTREYQDLIMQGFEDAAIKKFQRDLPAE